MGKVTALAIDLAKHVFQVVAEDARGEELWQKRLRSREEFTAWVEGLEGPLLVGLEAGLGAQAWARALQARGLDVRVLPAQRVADHRSGPKNDLNDARAILRAMRDSTVHPVPVKTVEQLTMQALHRVRSGWIRRRVALTNQIRGLLLEHGIAIAKGDPALTHRIDALLAGSSMPLPERWRDLLAVLWSEWQVLNRRSEEIEDELAVVARKDPLSRQLQTIPGVGPLTATAMVCKSLDARRFRNCRQFAAYFGPVPDQHSSGNKVRLGRMSRRGDTYVRSLLINGAQSALRVIRPDATDAHSRRLLRWKTRLGTKGAAVRLANHNLRVIWIMLQNPGATYHRSH